MIDTKDIKTVDILGDNRSEAYTKTRIGCRGIIVRDGKILISHEVNTGYYLIPGGGLEDGETPEQCCVREVLEETGYIVKPIKQYLTVNEYYGDYHFISHYFICEMLGEEQQHLTDEEQLRGLVPEWLDIESIFNIYKKYNDYAFENEDKCGAYLREYKALCEYIKHEDINARIVCAEENDIPAWMALVDIVADDFPGLDIADYIETLKQNIARKSTLCVKRGKEIAGILLFSPKHHCLSCMAVHPDYHRHGIATKLVAEILRRMPMGDISVTTFRNDDSKGDAPRALYLKFGFIPEELITDFDYPMQRFVLHRKDRE